MNKLNLESWKVFFFIYENSKNTNPKKKKKIKKGNIELKNIKIKKDAFSQFDLPLSVTRGKYFLIFKLI